MQKAKRRSMGNGDGRSSSVALARPGRRANASRGLLRDQAYARIKNSILYGEFPQGWVLTESELRARLGMSSTPIQAALQRLEWEGFVTISPKHGATVRTPLLSEVKDLFEARLGIESFVYERISGQLNPSQQAQLHACLDKLDTCAVERDLSGAIALDMEFHCLFCQFLGNRELLRELHRICEHMFRQIFLVLDENRLKDSNLDHRAIAEAVITGRAADATERLAAHLEWGKASLLRG